MSDEETVELYFKGFGAWTIAERLKIPVREVIQTLVKHGISRTDAEWSKGDVREWRTIKRKTKRKGEKKGLRVVTIPAKFIDELGFDREARLLGKWEISGKDLILHIREFGRESLSAKVKKRLGGDKK